MARSGKTKSKDKAGNGANLGFEAQLFLAADKMRGSMDAEKFVEAA